MHCSNPEVAAALHVLNKKDFKIIAPIEVGMDLNFSGNYDRPTDKPANTRVHV